MEKVIVFPIFPEQNIQNKHELKFFQMKDINSYEQPKYFKQVEQIKQ